MNRLSVVFCLVLLMSFSSVFSQKSINSYKYVIVPEQYEFQKSPDQYQVNSLTIFLFKKAGFNVLSSTESYPEDLAKNPCLALKGMVVNHSNILRTKVQVELIDCYNQVVFSSPIEDSKIKDYKKSYQEAVRKSFDTIQQLNYKYSVEKTKTLAPVVVAEEVVIAAPLQENVLAEATEEVIEPEVSISNPAIEIPEVSSPEVPTKAVAATTAVVAVKTRPKKAYTIEGTYLIDMWGECDIVKKGDDYAVIGGDENFQFATIYATSKPTIFMVKKTGFSQTQLVEIDAEGNLQMDAENGVKVYKRVE